MKKLKNKPTRKALVRAADRYFSLWVRQSHADRNGLVQCITCDNKKPIKKMQNGHFISRRFYSCRWLKENSAPQCYGCNIMDQGRQWRFSLYIDTIYGEGAAAAIAERANIKMKYTDQELIDLALKYKNLTDDYTNR